VVNAIAILSGTICDGAKPSCAAKIAAAVDAGILGYAMFLEDQQFYGGDGIVTKGADKTVTNVGRLAREGMRETDRTILKIMLEDPC
jgi:L-cysteine desulfidase